MCIRESHKYEDIDLVFTVPFHDLPLSFTDIVCAYKIKSIINQDEKQDCNFTNVKYLYFVPGKICHRDHLFPVQNGSKNQ